MPQVLHSLKALSIAVKNTLSQLRLKHEDIEELHITSKRWGYIKLQIKHYGVEMQRDQFLLQCGHKLVKIKVDSGKLSIKSCTVVRVELINAQKGGLHDLSRQGYDVEPVTDKVFRIVKCEEESLAAIKEDIKKVLRGIRLQDNRIVDGRNRVLARIF